MTVGRNLGSHSPDNPAADMPTVEQRRENFDNNLAASVLEDQPQSSSDCRESLTCSAAGDERLLQPSCSACMVIGPAADWDHLSLAVGAYRSVYPDTARGKLDPASHQRMERKLANWVP